MGPGDWDWSGFADLFGGLSGGISDIFNIGGSIYKTFRERELTEKTWQREDNAVQRRMADMKAAGINPVLAAGAPAQTMAPIAPSAPRMESTAIDKMAVGMSLMKQKAEIGRTFQEIENMKAQKEKTESEVHRLEYEKQLLAYQALETKNRWEYEELNKQITARDWELAKSAGIRYDIKGSLAQDIQQGIFALNHMLTDFKNGVVSGVAGEIKQKAYEALPDWVRGIYEKGTPEVQSFFKNPIEYLKKIGGDVYNGMRKLGEKSKASGGAR
jgi:hypothetical protein